MKLLNIFGTALLAGTFSIGAASAHQTTDRTKVKVKEGKDVTIAGCVDRDADGDFVLTTADTGRLKYVLLGEDSLEKYIGRQVEVKGTAADRGKAKVKIEEKVKTEREDSDDTEAHRKTEIEGNIPGMHYLAVKSVKPLSDRCQ